MPKPDLIDDEQGFVIPWCIWYEHGSFWISRKDSRDYTDWYSGSRTLRIYRENGRMYFSVNNLFEFIQKRMEILKMDFNKENFIKIASTYLRPKESSDSIQIFPFPDRNIGNITDIYKERN